MPAVFGAYSQPGGKRNPVFEDSDLLKYSRKYKHGKRVGRREVVEKFKALAIGHERALRLRKICSHCLWEEDFDRREGNMDEEAQCAELEDHWDDCCELLYRNGYYLGSSHVKGVYAINRQAFLIRARAVGHEDKDSDSHLRRHRSSKQKRGEAKKNGWEALRDFRDCE